MATSTPVLGKGVASLARAPCASVISSKLLVEVVMCLLRRCLLPESLGLHGTVFLRIMPRVML